MIDTNLSTRPFYNERTVTFWLALLGVLVAVATAWNVSRVIRFSGANTELALRASADEQRAADARRDASRLRASVDARQIDAASAEARLANDLIDRRTFSWTELFNEFETTLPDDVRIVSVTPRIDQDRRIMLSIVVIARGVDDVDAFMERLDDTGHVRDLRSTRERTTEEGEIESVLEARYFPQGATP